MFPMEKYDSGITMGGTVMWKCDKAFLSRTIKLNYFLLKMNVLCIKLRHFSVYVTLWNEKTMTL